MQFIEWKNWEYYTNFKCSEKINNRKESKDCLVFFECENSWDLLCIYEIEFRINGNDLNVNMEATFNLELSH